MGSASYRGTLMSRPNVLWICTDQQRFDSLGCYGNEFVETPNVDRLARTGTRFSHAYAQSPVCTPSRASFLTGRYPRTTRCRQNGQSIPESELLITRRLAEAGYNCGLAGKLHLGPADPTARKPVRHAEPRIEDGYGVFHWSHASRQPFLGNEYRADWLREQGLEYEATPVRGSEYVFTSMPAEHHQTTWAVQKAIDFLEFDSDGYALDGFDEDADAADAEEPWLFSVNVFDPHVPFDPPAEYLEPYLDRLEEIPLPNHADGERADKPAFQEGFPTASGGDVFDVEEMDPEDHRLIRAAYWAMIDLVDDQVGRLLDALERTGQREETLVIFMSDHGELLGDHGIYLKGPFFYEPAVRVPLVMSWPGEVEAGLVSDALVELTDLAPTLCDAAGLDPHPGMQGDSLWPILTGRSDPDSHREDVYCEYYQALERPELYGEMVQRGGNPDFHRHLEEPDVKPAFHDALAAERPTLPYATMVRTERYKLVHVHSLETGELYDLEADPNETKNLWDDPDAQSTKLELFRRLSNRMAQTVDPLPQREGRW
jgi:arylsulfatase A-like enzyme